MKLMLGTAQFGIPYGAFNAGGQVPLETVKTMLDIAADSGIDMLDTARAYGEAETVLARCGAPARFRIVSKCPDLSAEEKPVAALHAAFDSSCEAMGTRTMYGYLLHNAEDIMRSGVWEALCALRDDGRVERIGVSGYEAEVLAKLCLRYPLTLVQLPANVLDPWYDTIELPNTVEVHVRSAFLQGFLLSDPASLPPHLAPFRPVLEEFRANARAHRLTTLEAALAPLLSSPCVTKVAVGADNPEHFEQILQAVQALDGRSVPKFSLQAGATKNLTDPRLWRTAV